MFIYGPNSDSPGFFTDIVKQSADMAIKKIFIGDWNVVLNPDLDSNNPHRQASAAAIQINEIQSEHMLQDIWRKRNPMTKRFSWYRVKPVLSASRLDYALIADGLESQVHDVFYLNGLRSDHSAFFIGFKFCSQERGPSYWKFNTQLLNDKQYLHKINVMLEEKQIELSDLSPSSRWELIKESIQQITKKYSKDKAVSRREKMANINEEIVEMEENILNLNEEEMSNLAKLKDELSQITLDITKGALFRSKCKWYEEGEKNSRYFYSLEAARYNAKTCTKILTDDGKEITMNSEILNAQHDFYQKLYARDKSIEFVMGEDAPIKVSDQDVELQSQTFTRSDLASAVRSLQNNKCPGPDGIPIDFYKVFWSSLVEPLYEAIMDVYNRNSLYATAARGVLNLIPKKGKDVRMLKNLRPITLLNTDYKIIEKMLVKKIMPALEYIINHDQKGFMPNRHMTMNIRKLFDIIKYTDVEKIPAIIMQIDFAKAFDKCETNSLCGVLQWFGFSSEITKWIKLLYSDFRVRVQNNGFFSDYIEIQRSVHQGAPASAAFFICIAEALAISVRAN